jgi:hypothetical protein
VQGQPDEYALGDSKGLAAPVAAEDYDDSGRNQVDIQETIRLRLVTPLHKYNPTSFHGWYYFG